MQVRCSFPGERRALTICLPFGASFRSALGVWIMLFLVVSTPRPERPSDLVGTRQSFWPWIAGYQARGVCRHIYARAGRGAVAVFDVEDNDALHRILNEWADIVPAHFDTYPLIEADAAQRMLAAQTAAPPG
jgi:hypothetical protein